MPNRKLVRHGTNSGYRAELGAGNGVCNRCHNAHLVYQSQYTATNRAKGIKYKGDQVIDQLYQSVIGSGAVRSGATHRSSPPVSLAVPDFTLGTVPSGSEPHGAAQEPSGPSLADRIRNLAVGNVDNDYVNEDAIPDYITVDAIDPDPEPDGQEYEQVPEDAAEFVINAAGMAKIEDSLGTYLSIVGITMEMVDPYCGPILAQNMDNIVHRWAKVIGKYPKAAELFMDGKGGTVMLWIGAIQATWPVLFAMYEHHFSKDIQTSGGQIFRKTEPSTGRFDPTMPPMPDNFQYSAG